MSSATSISFCLSASTRGAFLAVVACLRALLAASEATSYRSDRTAASARRAYSSAKAAATDLSFDAPVTRRSAAESSAWRSTSKSRALSSTALAAVRGSPAFAAMLAASSRRTKRSTGLPFVSWASLRSLCARAASSAGA
ncbi:MAG: hypothetical protein HY721_23335 [Planctomycetes bacterium]|nr:hypothetical protein [Planctomycetota bacterium]